MPQGELLGAAVLVVRPLVGVRVVSIVLDSLGIPAVPVAPAAAADALALVGNGLGEVSVISPIIPPAAVQLKNILIRRLSKSQ